MDKRYRQIYEELLNDFFLQSQAYYPGSRIYQFIPESYDIISSIDMEIKRFQNKHPNYDLRPDAEYFMFLNFYNMIALPLLVESNRKEMSRIQDAILTDVGTI